MKITHNGIYRAVVKDNKDPKNLKRLKLQIAQVTGNEVTDWVWPSDLNGISTKIPDIGQGVWVKYIGGDPEYPMWLGVFGKQSDKSKKIYIEALLNSVNTTPISSYLVIKTQQDKSKEVDLTATLVAIANTLKSFETRITTLEGKVTTLKNTLATKTTTGHTHNSNG